MALVLGRLKPLLEDPAVLKIGHNFKYDWVMFDKAGIDVAPVDDTMVLSFDLDAGRSFGHGLEELAKIHFDHECIPFKALCGTGAKQITFDKVPLGPATEYAGEDADIALRLWLRLKPRLAQENVTRVYERVDKPLVPVIGADGAARDQGRPRVSCAAVGASSRDDIQALEEKIYEAACGPFTIGSTQQLGQVLYERLGLKGGRKGKSGHYSTDVTELERLATEGVRLRAAGARLAPADQARSTYTDALQAVINPETGRVHTSFSLTGAQTGRLSSNDPNLQNIPIRTEVGRKIRDAFVADPGHVLLSADYSQIELRLAAHMADVPQLKEAFRAGEDIHGHDRPGAVREGRPRNAQPGQDHQLRHPLRKLVVGDRRAARRAEGGRQSDHRPLFRALPRNPRLHPQHFGLRPRAWLHLHLVRKEDAFRAQHPLAQPVDPRRRRARGDQRAAAGHQRRFDQARDDADGRRAGRGRPRGRADAPPGP